MMIRLSLRNALLLACAASPFISNPAFAQSVSGTESGTADTKNVSASDGDIIVTARKRDETSIAVPVAISAVGSAELQRRAIVGLDDVSRIVPQLSIAPAGAVQGGFVAIRGITGPSDNPFGDQAVAFNIDGVQVAKSSVRLSTNTDLAQIEVLKGPQALFYGKNSPAGVVTIHTADPTPHFEAKISAGYEPYAGETRLEGYVSGPLTDSLGFRVAGYYSHIHGYFDNVTGSGYPSSDKSALPRSNDGAVRLTLKWTPDSPLTAKFKFNYSLTHNSGPESGSEYINCPYGSPQTGAQASCVAGGVVIRGPIGPTVAALDSGFRNGEPFQREHQILSGLELNYALSDAVTLTSVTGLYDVGLDQAENFERDYVLILPSHNTYKDRDLSEELRIQTKYDGPLNFSGGLYYSNTRASTGSHTFFFSNGPASELSTIFYDLCPANNPCQINNYYLRQKGRTYSAFLQLNYKPIDTLEISAGGRYSSETKSLPLVEDGTGLGVTNALGLNVVNVLGPSAIISTPVTHKTWTDFSPEVTVNWRPSRTLTLYGSYKHGFLSGGFNSGSTSFALPLDYKPETVKGFEAGVKALMLGSALRVNADIYSYKVKDLQVTSYFNATQTISNAAAARVKGAEADFNYQTPLRGLSAHGAIAYNDAKYKSFPAAPCYSGETEAEGCLFSTAAGTSVQNLAGTRLPRSPKVVMSGGLSWNSQLNDTLKVALSVDANYSGSYITDITSDPLGKQHHYAMVDSTLRIGDANDRWEFAVIGKNLTNKYYWLASFDNPFTGGASGGATGVLADRVADLNRGRQVMLRLSYKFGA